VPEPFDKVEWPSQFNPRVGFVFQPGSVVKHTNHMDFWTVGKANSLGFLDVEPPPVEAGQCRVAFIGDSFVEAAQVEIPFKVQRLVEKTAAEKFPDWRVRTAAFGYSGTGQVNQLPFYDDYVKRLSPKLVVLVFVSNDFANNSSVLEALRNGWHPDHAPRLFVRRTDRGMERVEIDPNWSRYRIDPGLRVRALQPVHAFLQQRSRLYQWLWRRLSLKYPGLNVLQGTPYEEMVRLRARALQADPQVADRMVDWRDEFSENLDGGFTESPINPLYADAEQYTQYALSEFLRRADQDGTQLVVLAASQMGLIAQNGRNGSLAVLKRITASLGIPLIDQYEFVVHRGGDPKSAQFAHDGHWTKAGHRWAAEAVMEYLENQSVCGMR
jgi:hypothetical protein